MDNDIISSFQDSKGRRMEAQRITAYLGFNTPHPAEGLPHIVSVIHTARNGIYHIICRL